jgi:type I restriction enzyme S subunit
MPIEDWPLRRLGEFIVESRIPGSGGDAAKKLTVKLYGRGVVEKSAQGSAATRYYKRRAGQLIYSKLDCLNGAFGIVPKHLDGYQTTLDLPSFDFKGEVSPSWLLALLSRPSFYGRYKSAAIGSRKAVRVPPSELLATKLQVPPLPEQRAIADVLDAADVAIKASEGEIAALERNRLATLQRIFTQLRAEKRLVGETELLELASVGRWLSGGTPSKKEPAFWDGDFPLVCPKDLKRKRISTAIDTINREAAAKQTKIAPTGAMLIVVRGMILARALPTSVTTTEVAFNQDVRALVPKNGASAAYIQCWIEAHESRLLGLVSESTHGTKRLPSDTFFALPVPVPPLPEQQRIAEIGEAFDARNEAERAVLEARRDLKAALASELLSGRERLPQSLVARYAEPADRAKAS